MSAFRAVILIALLPPFAYLVCFSLAQAKTTPNEQVHLNSRNTVTFRGVVDESSTIQVQLDLVRKVKARGAQGYPIYLVLDTPGGDVSAGLQFIEVAKTIENLKTITIFAASMGSAIAEGIPGNRLITNNGVLMFHRAAGRVGGQFEVGEMETRLNDAKLMVRNMEQTNADRIGITLADYKARVVNEWWLQAKEALSIHAADKVVDIVCSIELIDSRTTATVESIFGSSTLDYSGCPTFRYPVPNKKNAVAFIGL